MYICVCVYMCVFFLSNMANTHRHTVLGTGFFVREVADGPGEVVGGHARCPSEAIGHPSVLICQGAALNRHVGQGGVQGVVAEAERERGLVDGLVEAGEGLSGVDRTKLGHRQVAAREKRRQRESPLIIIVKANNDSHLD